MEAGFAGDARRRATKRGQTCNEAGAARGQSRGGWDGHRDQRTGSRQLATGSLTRGPARGIEGAVRQSADELASHGRRAEPGFFFFF